MKLEKELREWNFDDQLPVLARTGTEDPIESRLYGMCASSTTGKLFIYGGLIDQENQILSNRIDYYLYIQNIFDTVWFSNWNSSKSCFIGDTIFIYGGGQSRNMVAEKHRTRGCAAFHPKSLYISYPVSYLYEREIEIWAGFGPVGNTEKKWEGRLWATFEGGLFMFLGAKYFFLYF